MLCYLAGMEPYYLKCIKDGPFQPKTADGDAKPESQWTLNERRVFVYEDNLIQRRYSDTKKALITTPSSSVISTDFFSNIVIQDFQENSNDEVDERSSKEYLRDLDVEYQERDLLANSKRFIKRRNNFSSPKEEVSEDEEVTQVKVLMTLADDELTVRKSHAPNGEWVDITIRKGASPSSAVMPLTFQPHFPKERPGLGHNRVIHIRGGILAETSQSDESLIGVKCNRYRSTIHSTFDHNEFDYFKRACEKGKHHSASYKTKQNFSIRKCLHLLHMDLFRPVSPMSINHEKYTLVIVDEYSRMVENQNDVKVKQIRTDNGTEFRNHELESFCDEK
nr:retrovirus-related Pol polyprotein from transposon TNT 1-94 [Tanacetum cinerariifolium]